MLTLETKKLCHKCNIEKPLTEEFFYRARPTATHKKEGNWQSHCKACWKVINKLNKLRVKVRGNVLN